MTALPPKPMHNFHPLRFSPPTMVSDDERRAMIALEAYLRAERRNFEPGREMEDWVAAELEIDSRLQNIRNLVGVSEW